MEEKIGNVKFDDNLVSSPYLKPVRLHFERRGKPRFWDLALERDTVSCLLYHKEQNVLLFVKQFRPPVFVRKVRKLPENIGKTVHEINWESYPVSLGETIELCAGLMDKPNLNALQHIHEEIMEECGYKVPLDQIQLIKKYIPNVAISGNYHYVYYAEIDESMKVSDGGGNIDEGEFIAKVYMKLDEAQTYIKQTEVDSPPGFLYAVRWFLDEYDQKRLPLTLVKTVETAKLD